MCSAFFCSRVPAVCGETQESGYGRFLSRTVRTGEIHFPDACGRYGKDDDLLRREAETEGKSMDLFDYMKEKHSENESPLASRMRPRTLSEVVGQQHIIGRGRLLYRAIRADKLTSVIFYGPPGTGKTTLARVIANSTNANFRQLNATTSGKKDMEVCVEEARKALGGYGRRTILFIDEIHRFNKSQQDYLLPFVEDGTVIQIGRASCRERVCQYV